MRSSDVTTKEEIVTFDDASDDKQEAGITVPTSYPFANMALSDVTEFLKRPVKIATFNWTTAGLNLSFDPYELFLADIAVARKVSNYLMLRTGGINIKIVVNGSQYQFGRYFIGFWPYPDELNTTFALSSPTRISTLPCFITIDPGANTSAMMCIPEFQERERRINGAFSLGLIVGTQAALLNTTSTITPVCDITFYASMVDPRVAYNTTGKSLYGTSSERKGVVSKPLATLSRAATTLSEIPFLAPFATPFAEATKMGARMAALFGFSKPPNESDPQPFIQRTIGNTINSEGLDNAVVMALSKTAITTVDSRVFGLTGEDEMALAAIFKRPSLYAQFDWTDAQTAGTQLATLHNSPNALPDYTYPCALTNLAYVTAPFKFYRGSINYKFVFNVSKFHTGRIQIVYEPSSFVSTLDPTNVTLNWIVDLAEGAEISINIPYVPYTIFNSTIPDSLIGTSVKSSSSTLGTIRCFVLNPLRCGAVTTAIRVHVFNSGGDDFELAVPTASAFRSATSIISYYPSGTPTTTPAASAYSNWGTSMELSSPLTSSSFSERILSLRQIMKRYQFEKYISATGVPGFVSYKALRAVPNQVGFVQSGATILYHPEPFTFFTYWAPSFTGWRGSIRKKLVSQTASTNIGAAMLGYTVGNYMSGSAPNNTEAGYVVLGCGLDGFVVNQQRPNAVETLEVVIPWRDDLHFRRTMAAVNDSNTGRGLVLINLPIATETETKTVLTACGDDFSFLFYRGAPVVYNYTVSPG